MFAKLRRTLRELRSHTSGNATLLVAVGMPALVGGAGLAVDISQWYMWKREMQFAVDQAALAGAWAMTSSDTAVQGTYTTRAQQEYGSNLSMVEDIDSTPSVTLAKHNSASNNSVLVSVNATTRLPFSGFLTDSDSTVFVQAQATYAPEVPGSTTTTTLPAISACMVALNTTAQGALTIGGTASGAVTCGGATLSTHSEAAIEENGNPSASFNQLAAAGGIEASLLDNVGNVASRLKSGQTGMSNPFASLAEPTGSGVAQTYSCPSASTGTTTTTADVSTTTTYEYRYFVGANTNTTTALNPTPTTAADGYVANPADGAPTGPTNQTVPNGTSAGTVTNVTAGTYTQFGGSGNARKYRVLYTTVKTTYANVVPITSGGSDGVARPNPGTYTNISIACDTEFQPGVYVITGSIDFSSNKIVTSAAGGVLFVMKNANNISNINSNSSITMSGISASTLTTVHGYTSAAASKYAGMLFWDPLSTSQIKWNGNSASILNGALYMPKRQLWFNGTASVTGRCMMLIADTLQFTGTIDLASFCQTTGSNNFSVREETITTVTSPATPAVVKLVA